MKSTKKSNLFHIKAQKTKGFSLVEIILAVGIFSLIFMLISSFVYTSTKTSKDIISYNDLDTEISYTVNYIFNEIDQADFLIEKSFELTNNKQLNLFMVTKLRSEYSVTSYIFDKKEIKRGNFKKSKLSELKTSSFKTNYFTFNPLISNIKDFSSTFDRENKILSLEIVDKNDNTHKYSHYIRGVIDE